MAERSQSIDTRLIHAGEIRPGIESDVAAAVAAELDCVVAAWYCAGLPGDRGQTGEQLAQRLQKAGTQHPGFVFETVQQALEAALAESGADDGLLIFGSFQTASEAAKALRPGVSTTGPC